MADNIPQWLVSPKDRNALVYGKQNSFRLLTEKFAPYNLRQARLFVGGMWKVCLPEGEIAGGHQEEFSTMSIYADSAYPVRGDLATIHASQLDQLGAPGTWGTGAQRLAIAAEARKAGYDAGRLEEPDDGAESPEVILPEVTRNVVRRLAVSPKDVDESFYSEARDGGLSDAEYVEIVGLVARITDLDIFARGIGGSPKPLPSPKPGEPSRERPDAAMQEQAWVPTIPNPPEGGKAAEEIYGGHPKPYIVRGLSLVPDELRRHVELIEVQYLPLRRIVEPDYQHHESLTRAQVEIIAGRVSVLNECFY